MPNESLSTVKICSFNLEKVLGELRHSASELIKNNPNVEKFCSLVKLVKGNYARQDADSLIILKQDNRRIMGRTP
jgi:hypothetical protein